MDSDLWEIRSHISDKRISRIFFTIVDNNMVLLHGYIKKSQTTPKEELDLAKKRRDMFLTGGSR